MKRQTLILVVVGVLLFVAGGAIAFASVISGNKNQTTITASPVNTPVVVATANLPAGTTGQDMVAKGQVSLKLIPQKNYVATDLPSLQSLSNQVLTSAVKKGDAIQATQLRASASDISLPTGMDAVSVTTSGVSGLAGYLQPGSNVDVYANVTKLSQLVGANVPVPNMPLPCTELVMSNIEVLDVSDIVPALATHPSTAGRTVPPSVTLLLAVNPGQARVITFMTQNETLAVAQTQKGTTPVAVGTCIGTGQTTTAP